MKKLLIILLFIPGFCYSQDSASKEYSSNGALNNGKRYILDTIFGGATNKVEQIYIDGLPGGSFSELTTLYYNGSGKEGLVLGIFDRKTNEYGVKFYDYIYLNLDREDAISFFTVVDYIKDTQKSYLGEKNQENHVYFKVRDITFLLYLDGGYKMKVFWKEYISDWQGTGFERMKRKFEKRINQANKGKIGN